MTASVLLCVELASTTFTVNQNCASYPAQRSEAAVCDSSILSRGREGTNGIKFTTVVFELQSFAMPRLRPYVARDT